MPVTEDQLRFHLEEYKATRAEIAATIKTLYETFFGGALASGAIAAWLFTNYDKVGQFSTVAQHGAWFIPFGVALIACLGFYHFNSIIMRVAAYNKKLEGALAAEGLGWERYQASDYPNSTANMSRLRFGAGWAVILAADLALAIFVR